MPRTKRIDCSNSFFHVFSRAAENMKIFIDDEDYQSFLKHIKQTMLYNPFICYVYVLLPENFHLIIQTSNSSLETIMKSLLRKYADYYNKKYVRKGALFADRYSSIIFQKELHLNNLLIFLHRYTENCGLCDDYSKWPWSSYQTYCRKQYDGIVNPMLVLNSINIDDEKSLKIFKRIHGDGSSAKPIINYLKIVNNQILGDGDFVEMVRKRSRMPEIKKKIKLSELKKKMMKKYGEEVAYINSKSRKRRVSRLRAIFCYIAYEVERYEVSKIARFIKKDPSTINHAVNKIKTELINSGDPKKIKEELEL